MHQGEETKIDLLKNLLLNDDRLEINALKLKIKHLEDLLESKKQLSKKVDPIIDKKLDAYTEEIPIALGPVITESLKNEIENSKDQVVDALYPIIGKMIKKYIQKEFQILSEKINSQIKKRFSFMGFFRTAKSKFTGVEEDQLILNQIGETEIQEIYIIEKNSGILKGNYSITKTIDKDVLSGMLTAIKSFVEDAFKTGNDNLESIEYGLYNIHIQNFKTYYIAVVVHGVFDANYQQKLKDKLLNFSKKHYKATASNSKLSNALKTSFS
ncbi:cell envelope biogenesis protein OmpA [uncultured Winogradskyella sp.]|uniref:cell envelope biogenesis protein OmpA n=1 Tax=uncultured Winogradskyella sp. TaxID=395353 RepID=UPI0026309ACC|nr:cell envelope biogenesis protein OmpA [uncultured Winogradskyella sp.]